MPNFVSRFRRALPSAFEEWVISFGVLSIGMLWLFFPNSFNRIDMIEFVEVMSPRAWTGTAITIGLLSCVAIASNTEAPRVAGFLRVVACASRVTFWFAFLGRAIASSQFDALMASLGIILYSMLIVLDSRYLMRSVSSTFNAFRKVQRVRPYSLVR